jgi:uncharacterized membrane protein (DUF485 family)
MTGDHSWEAIERSPEFRALVSSRRRFVAMAGGTTVGLCVAYVLVAYLAPDLMGEAGGWIAGVGLIVLTGIVSLLYLRRSDSVWAPMEQSITAHRTGRFERDTERERVS